ncbi:MAG: TetR/AcrR family transcriptional regulator [Anaerolineales bacterium]|nr:TetR/AcrR family transcriptional regulator [Anaerolineales bacterium]
MPARIYVNHRENQRDRILACARELFIDRGIQAVTLSDIAVAAHLTRATLYKYFTNKEDLAQAIFQVTTRGWVERGEREVWSIPGTGYERVERFVRSHANAMFQNPREARFVAEFNALYAREWPVERMAPILTESLGSQRRQLYDSVRQGQAEGSLRVDLAPDVLVAAILNFVSGMMDRLGAMGAKVEGEYGIAAQTVFEQINRVFLSGLTR